MTFQPDNGPPRYPSQWAEEPWPQGRQPPGNEPNNGAGGAALKAVIVVAVLVVCAAGCLGVRQVAQDDGPAQAASQTAAGTDTDAATPGSAERTVTVGDDLDCVLNNVDDALLPSTVNSLEELHAAAVSPDAMMAYTQADLACHGDPIGSDAFAEHLRTVLDLSLGVVEVDTGEARCVIKHVTDNYSDAARILTVATEVGDVDAFREAMLACFDADEAAYLNREPGSGPQNYGDDPALDSLFDDCSDGDERACDLLWFGSTEGSEYSSLAFDCAGRGATPSGFCTPGIEVGSDEYAVADSPGVAKLLEECRDGDGTACDLLGSIAAPGSKIESIGYNCGGRFADIVAPDCRTAEANS